MTVERTTTPETSRPSQRRWQDLRAGRICLGLSVGSIAMTVISATLLFLEGSTSWEEIGYFAVGEILIGVVWSLLAGWAYLLMVSRQRGRIERNECLVLGIAIFDLFPIVVLLTVVAFEGERSADGMFGEIGHPYFLTLLGMLSLMGLLAGWLFWRIGIRPSRGSERHVAAVFD